MTPPRDFLGELKRRRVFRVAVTYGAVAFAVLQAADLIAPRVGLPDWTVTLVIVLAALGLPIALVLGWMFDLTPAPVERNPEEDVRPAPWLGFRTIVVAALMLVAGIAAGMLARPGKGSASGDGKPRVAVLPFENIGADSSTETFVEGVHDDLLTQLSKIASLRVTSRTSVLEYRRTTKNIRLIAQELGVAHVLEGGVQRAGNRVRINAQLIDARTDEHVWADTYDETLTAENVFAIQGKIAGSIARALSATLTPQDSSRLATPPTRLIEAADYYYRGRELYMRRTDAVAAQIVTAFEHAVALDSSYALAWAGLSAAHAWMVRSGLELDTMPALVALERARRLAPDAPETAMTSGYYAYYARGDYASALAEFKRAEQLWPGQADIKQASSLVLRRVGRWDDAIATAQAAIELDPRNFDLLITYAETLFRMHRFEDAQNAIDRAVVLNPQSDRAQLLRMRVVLRGFRDTARARQILADISTLPASIALSPRVDYAFAVRDYVGAIATANQGLEAMRQLGLTEAEALSPAEWHPRLIIGVSYWLMGDVAHARIQGDSLRRAVAERLAQLRPAGKMDLFGLRALYRAYNACALALMGDRSTAIREAEAAVNAFNEKDDTFDGVSPREFAAVAFIIAGDYDRAVNDLERMVSIPSSYPAASLTMYPVFTKLTDNQRFRALIRQ